MKLIAIDQIKILLTIVGFIILFPNICFSMSYRKKAEGKGLYFYSGREISRFLKDIGYPNLSIKASWDVSKNSKGTALRFFDWSNNEAIIVSCNGLIKKIDLPGTATWSGRPIWFNDEHQPIAWLEKEKVYYKNDMSEEPPFKAYGGADPSGKYFMKEISSVENKNVSVRTAIYSIEKSDLPLAKVDLLGERIFFKDNKIFLFGNTFRDRDEQRTMYIFQVEDNKLEEIERVIIKRPRKSPAPFNIEDFSPWNDEVLFCDVHDFPFRSEWYVYNLKTREMKNIGKEPFSGGWGFYLQCDIIKEVTKKLKERQ